MFGKDRAMLMPTTEGERRAHPRQLLQRDCKVFDPRGRRYHTAATRDISSGGALIDLPRLTHLKPGDTIHVGIALKRRDQFLRADEMIQAEVIRALPTVDDHTTLAVKFAHAPALALDYCRPGTETETFRIAA